MSTAPDSRAAPSTAACTDKKCPLHGALLVKKEEHTGTVLRKDSHNSATIEWERQVYIPKYERYERRRSRLRVHNPSCIAASAGDHVRVRRTRPLSKTKHFAIVEVLRKASL